MDSEESIIIKVAKKKRLVVKKRQVEDPVKIEDPVIRDPVIRDPVIRYIANLSEIEKQVLEIARTNLESSFCIEKSIGFLEFQKTK